MLKNDSWINGTDDVRIIILRTDDCTRFHGEGKQRLETKLRFADHLTLSQGDLFRSSWWNLLNHNGPQRWKEKNDRGGRTDSVIRGLDL